MNDSTKQPVSLFDIIAWVESKNNPHAMRFEPAVFDRIRPAMLTNNIVRRIANANACSFGTAAMIYSCSWGATQIMGFNLYADDAPAHDASVLQFMGDPIMQAAMFNAFIMRGGMACTPDELASQPILRHGFAINYNGPGAPDAYVAQIVLALQHFGIAVTV